MVSVWPLVTREAVEVCSTREPEAVVPNNQVLLAAYNTFVANSQRQNDKAHKHPRHAAYATETSGLLLIAFLVLVLTLVRYWHAIRWSVR